MGLRGVLERVCHEYLRAKTEAFAKHPLADFIRNEGVEIIKQAVNDSELKVTGSAGQGNWADVPWFVIANEKETGAPQEGLYVDYLFSSDLKRVYLALGFGVSRPIERDSREVAFEKIAAQIAEIRTSHQLQGFNADNLLELSQRGLGVDYARATALYKEYSCESLPSEEELRADLKTLVDFYQSYTVESSVLTFGTDFSSVKEVEEGKRVLRQHYVRERNPKIVAEAKKKAMVKKGELRCEVCGFSFKEKYGERGASYIEGHHHTKSVSQMAAGDKTRVEDIALLCSNCHRMIHTKQPWLSIEELRESLQ